MGIPATEDKLLQLAVARILQAIYEQDFLRCSYGYRPNVGALDAVDKLTIKLQFGKYTIVVEADITGFFNRRSQRHSFNWDGFRQILEHFEIERPYIVGRPKTARSVARG